MVDRDRDRLLRILDPMGVTLTSFSRGEGRVTYTADTRVLRLYWQMARRGCAASRPQKTALVPHPKIVGVA